MDASLKAFYNALFCSFFNKIRQFFFLDLEHKKADYKL